MTDVQFTEEEHFAPRATYQKAGGGIKGWLVSHKFAANEAQANVLMLWVAGIAIVVAIGTPFLLTGSHGQLSPQERARIEQSTRIPSVRR